MSSLFTHDLCDPIDAYVKEVDAGTSWFCVCLRGGGGGQCTPHVRTAGQIIPLKRGIQKLLSPADGR
jgi:hypothetical protein